MIKYIESEKKYLKRRLFKIKNNPYLQGLLEGRLLALDLVTTENVTKRLKELIPYYDKAILKNSQFRDYTDGFIEGQYNCLSEFADRK